MKDLDVDIKTLYFTNVCMCPCRGAPPADKVHMCYDGLMDELEALKPKLIVPMGNVAAKAVGQYEKGISFVRGSYRKLRLGPSVTTGVLPTYHPAAILRNPDLFRDLLTDLEKAVAIGVEGRPAVIPPPYEDYEPIHTQEELEAVWPKLEEAKLIAVDLETASRYVYEDEILIIGISYAKGKCASFDWALFEPNPLTLQGKRNIKRLAKLLKTKKCIFQTAGFDIAWLWSRSVFPNLWFDTEVAHWLLDERESGHGLEPMAMRYLSAPPWKAQFRTRNGLGAYIASEEQFGAKFSAIPQDDMMMYNAADADYTRRLAMLFRKEIKKQNMERVMRLVMDATKLYTELFLEGMCIDMNNLEALETKYKKQIAEAEVILEKLAPDVNPRSPKQLSAYLYDQLGLTTFGDLPADGAEIPMDVLSKAMMDVEGEDVDADLYWKTSRPALFSGRIEKGSGLSSRSTGAFTLFWLKRQHPYPAALIQYKQAQKRLKTYCGAIHKFMWTDGRIHPDYRLVGHLHGRFRSSRPTIHNIPNETDIYNIYCAPPGMTILHADYKQADLRLIAHMSGDQELVRWLKGDPHAEVVKAIRHLNDEQLKELEKRDINEFRRSRLAAKSINFGAFYGRGAESMAPQLGLTVKEARLYLREYWKRLPVAKAWMDSRFSELLANGQEYIGPFGNKRRFPLLVSESHRWRVGTLGVNFPIMSSVNYLTTMTHIAVVKNLRAVGIQTLVYPHIHDSINVCVPEDKLQEAAQIIKDTMSQVPIDAGFDGVTWPVDVDAGTHWGSMVAVENLFESST